MYQVYYICIYILYLQHRNHDSDAFLSVFPALAPHAPALVSHNSSLLLYLYIFYMARAIDRHLSI